ncbi:alpha/beta hydrolase [Bacillus sp. SM2101]|uniref:alpha/beta fold hydrolase n=1 Tax=Bacillus sp. SM2101 TaxID=2805366 RepID=UPI001BDF4C26|nr:alpha/beta hydrolase [Bacillus sp. SM2101]
MLKYITNRLKDEGDIYKSLIPMLSEIETPMLLLLGQHDPVTCEKQIEAFNKNGKNRMVYVFENSGHTPHYEKANVFTDVVVDYINTKVNE